MDYVLLESIDDAEVITKPWEADIRPINAVCPKRGENVLSYFYYVSVEPPFLLIRVTHYVFLGD